ncbi:ORF219 [White spot syndrome virus]|uniref:ORF219 n=1 Tax=White spot syndrome virus TaxID=342409 RepID=A0A2D3I625_9VIRU|nr:ORF219 [White spot syndrome virus]
MSPLHLEVQNLTPRNRRTISWAIYGVRDQYHILLAHRWEGHQIQHLLHPGSNSLPVVREEGTAILEEVHPLLQCLPSH